MARSTFDSAAHATSTSTRDRTTIPTHRGLKIEAGGEEGLIDFEAEETALKGRSLVRRRRALAAVDRFLMPGRGGRDLRSRMKTSAALLRRPELPADPEIEPDAPGPARPGRGFSMRGASAILRRHFPHLV
jgi:hypothetical protein